LAQLAYKEAIFLKYN